MDELKNQPVTEKKVLNADTVSDEKVVQENLEKYDSESRYRRPEGFWKMAIKVICIAFSLFQFYTAGFGVLPAQIQRPLHVFFAFVLVFLLFLMFRKIWHGLRALAKRLAAYLGRFARQDGFLRGCDSGLDSFLPRLGNFIGRIFIRSGRRQQGNDLIQAGENLAQRRFVHNNGRAFRCFNDSRRVFGHHGAFRILNRRSSALRRLLVSGDLSSDKASATGSCQSFAHFDSGEY